MNSAVEARVREVVVARQYRGPPQSGNGGYVSGLLAHALGADVTTAVLRAPIPLDEPLRLESGEGEVQLLNAEGALIARAGAGDRAELPAPPSAPSYVDAEAAGRGFVGLDGGFHPICFTCASGLAEGYGCRVFVGQLHGAALGVVAGVWTPHANFAAEDGLTRTEVVWAAIDCPGSLCWVVQGAGGGLLGTMTGEILRRPAAGEACVVLAWPLERSGRKLISGVALFTADGELLARARQIWIGSAPAA